MSVFNMSAVYLVWHISNLCEWTEGKGPNNPCFLFWGLNTARYKIMDQNRNEAKI